MSLWGYIIYPSKMGNPHWSCFLLSTGGGRGALWVASALYGALKVFQHGLSVILFGTLHGKIWCQGPHPIFLKLIPRCSPWPPTADTLLSFLSSPSLSADFSVSHGVSLLWMPFCPPCLPLLWPSSTFFSHACPHRPNPGPFYCFQVGHIRAKQLRL